MVKEATFRHSHPVVQLGLRYGMLLFIASEVMFFVAFFWAYFDPALSSTEGAPTGWRHLAAARASRPSTLRACRSSTP